MTALSYVELFYLSKQLGRERDELSRKVTDYERDIRVLTEKHAAEKLKFKETYEKDLKQKDVDKNTKIKKANEEIARLKNKISQQEESIKKLKQENKSLKICDKKLNKMTLDEETLKDRITTIKENNEKLKAKNLKLAQEILALHKQRDLQKEEDSLHVKEKMIEKLQLDLETCKLSNQSFENDLLDAKKEIHRLQKQIKDTEAQETIAYKEKVVALQNQTEKCEALVDELWQAKRDLKRARDERENACKTMEQLREEMEEINREKESMFVDIYHKQLKIDGLGKKLDGIKANLKVEKETNILLREKYLKEKESVPQNVYKNKAECPSSDLNMWHLKVQDELNTPSTPKFSKRFDFRPKDVAPFRYNGNVVKLPPINQPVGHNVYTKKPFRGPHPNPDHCNIFNTSGSNFLYIRQT
ncbi:coiled-coil domain-containing protein 18-like [Nothobranchius furzeri]|uniref:Coiled-coil domain-containing protein 18-like n=1 Tax=Nothobranchius furzeri TaxID=105023 RepID=A0A9D2Y403_NOTFU|nr:coiled-coil domain-containing protein 18-like [Nothobranchius furzeri]